MLRPEQLMVSFASLPDGSVLVYTPSQLVERTVVYPWSSATWHRTVAAQFSVGVGIPRLRLERQIARSLEVSATYAAMRGFS